MSINRIHQDDEYLIFHIPSDEVVEKLGRAYPIHIDHSPIQYASVWPAGFRIEFLPEVDSDAHIVPDLSVSGGKLFLSEKAYGALKSLLETDGEFLPVEYHKSEKGYLFNPLVIAEDMDALDEARTGYDEHGNLEHFDFIENKLESVATFKAKIDHFNGVFCRDTLKNTIEETGLTGVYFQPDLANFSGESSDTSH
ncbi:hypothetical protein [Microbulbifer rhizosphaerae]|uniref:Uncharacterized protein n=1 Tax=Microbulbifer rhizosphaerae TaxID=1562603 RepID=A0A7W4W9A0_9GAMM|nr:hypothetical protein [Microbulbifer rhizosphaerae]MBB3060062.1 hypothetical protein [Microbulbifer rhizosphaerae]